MDVVLVGFIAGFIFGGFRSGFVHRLLGILFLVLSLVLAAYFRYPVGAVAAAFFKDIPSDYAELVGYTIAFPVILAAFHIGTRMIFGKLQFQGVSKGLDSALGAVFGGVEAVLILSAAVVILDAYFGTSSTLAKSMPPGVLKELTQALNGSTTVHLLRDSTVPVVLAVVGPLLPKDVSQLLPTGLPTRLPFPTARP